METKAPAIYAQLLEFQKKGVSIKKTAENEHFRNNYADINEVLAKVRTPLSEVGIVLTQIPDTNGLKTVLLHVESGTSVESYLEFLEKGTVQKLGSNITYYRRYALVSMLGLEADDDDGNAAAATAPSARPAARPAAPAPKPTAPSMTAEVAIAKLVAATTTAQLQAIWKAIPNGIQKDPEVLAMKDQRKDELTNQTA